MAAVRTAVRKRHYHRGFMAEYEWAKALGAQADQTGAEPVLASQF